MEKEKKIEVILESLEGIERAGAPEFFYTRLKAKMEKGLGGEKTRPFLVRPVFAFALLAVVLFINAAVIFTSGSSAEKTAVNEADRLQSIAADYNMNDISSLYDLNAER